MYSADWKYRPDMSLACTVTCRSPLAMGSETLRLPPDEVHCLTPSTQTNMLTTMEPESLVPARIFTGDATVELAAGVQIVTDGSTALCRQGGVTVRKKSNRLEK